MAASVNLDLSDEAKDSLRSHLKDLKFVDNSYKLKAYSCCACKKLAIRHCFANCGDVFCNNCYQGHYKQPCPHCRQTIETNLQYPEFEKAMFKIKVHCKFEKNGCKDIVELRHLLDHIYKCKFSTEKNIPKLCKEDPSADVLQQLNDDVNCMKQIMGSLQEENSRICNDIQEMKNALTSSIDLQAATLIKLTDEFCKKDATDQMKAEIKQLKVDKKNYEETATALQDKNNSQIMNMEENYKSNKKAAELLQKEVTLLKEALQKSKEATKELQLEHKGEIQKFESQQRLHLEDLQTKLGTQFRNELSECRYLQEAVGDSIGGPVAILWKIAGFQERWPNLLSKKSIPIWSEEFFILNDALKFKPRLSRDSEGKFIYITLEFDHNSTDNSNMHLPYLHSRKYILLDQSNALEKTNIELIDRPHFGVNSTEKMMFPRSEVSKFFPVCLLKGENRYLKNDQILIKIILKPISFLYKNVASSDGTLLWRIDNYSKKKRDEIEGLQRCLKSKPFKTSETGYLLQVELYLNGYGSSKGQYLSIFLRLLMGENDANLPSTFKYKCLFSLMHQSDSQRNDDINNHTYSMEIDNKKESRGFFKFILQSQTESPKYLKSDYLLIKVVVQLL